MIALILAAVCAVSTPLAAGTPNFDGAPPARFHKLGTATVTLLPPDRIEAVCGTAPCGLQIVACTRGRHIYLRDPSKVTAADFRDDLIHEFAHAVGGWPSDHPR